MVGRGRQAQRDRADRLAVQHQCYPTLYILDSRGIIRHKFLGSVSKQKLTSVIDALVKAEMADWPAPR